MNKFVWQLVWELRSRRNGYHFILKGHNSPTALSHHLTHTRSLVPKFTPYVAVPDRNQILFHCVFRVHHQVWHTIVLSFPWGRGSYTLRAGLIRTEGGAHTHWGRGSYALHRDIRYSCVYTSRLGWFWVWDRDYCNTRRNNVSISIRDCHIY